MEGVRASARAVQGRGGPPRGHSHALGPSHDPDSRTLGGPYSLLRARLESLARSLDTQQRPTPSAPSESPPASLAAAPHAAPPGTRVPPAANLLVRVCFFGHFLVHLDACPAAGSLAPFIFLRARPPSSHLRHLLIWWWRGQLERKGAPRQAGTRGSPSARRGRGRGAPGSSRRHRPAGRGTPPPGLQRSAGARFGKGTRRGRTAEKQARSGRRAASRLRWGRAGVAPGDRANQGSG